MSILGECPEWQRGRTVNPLADAFVGSSPTSPTILRPRGEGGRCDLDAAEPDEDKVDSGARREMRV